LAWYNAVDVNIKVKEEAMAAYKNGFFILVILLAAALIMPAAGCIPAIQQQPTSPSASSVPVMVVSPDKLVFTIGQGQGPALDQVLSVVNQGGGILNQSMSDNAHWITLQPVPGAATAQTASARVAIDATGMALGQYTGIITVNADGALNSPIYVPVYLTILPGANIPPDIEPPPVPSSTPPADSAVVWVNQTDYYRYADVNALVVNGSVTNTDKNWYMANVKIVAAGSGNSVTITAQIPPGETVMYDRYIPSFQKDTVKLVYTWYKP
jgi:hypothetical protein